MSKYITGIRYDALSGQIYKTTIINFLSSFQEVVGGLIDIVTYKIEGTYYDIIVGDEALLVENSIPTAIDVTTKNLLFGSLFICHCDKRGNECSLKEGELNFIPIIHWRNWQLIRLER